MAQTLQKIQDAIVSQAGVSVHQFVLGFVREEGEALEILEPILQNDKEIVLASLSRHYYAKNMKFVDDNLKKDKAFSIANDSLLDDDEFSIGMVKRDGLKLEKPIKVK